MAEEWFVRRGDKVRGPLTSEEVKQLVAKDILRSSDMVRKSENPEWLEAGSIKGLFVAEQSEAHVPPPLQQSKAEVATLPVAPPLPSSPANRSEASSSHPSTAKAAETMQAGLADIMSTAKQAKDLASAHARKTQINQMTLPKAYLALGKDVLLNGRFREQFGDLFQRIAAMDNEISKIATTAKERPEATDIKGKLQTAAAQLMAHGQTTKLSFQRESLVRELGKKAFESHGTSAGSLELQSPITAASEEIKRLDEQIAAISSGDEGPLWQRLSLAALLTVFCWPVGILLVWLNPRLNHRSKWIWTGSSIGAFMVLAIVVSKPTETSTSTGDLVMQDANNIEATVEATVEAKPKDMITIRSNQLFSEYEANDIAADKRYKGQVLQVTGSVGNISRDILDTIYVTLKTGDFKIFSIQCFFADSFEDEAADLSPNQFLTIRGRCDGKFGNVILKDCIIVR